MLVPLQDHWWKHTMLLPFQDCQCLHLMKYSTSWLNSLPWLTTQQLQKTERSHAWVKSQLSSTHRANWIEWAIQWVTKVLLALVWKVTQILIQHPVMTCSPLQAKLPQPATEHLDPEYPLITTLVRLKHLHGRPQIRNLHNVSIPFPDSSSEKTQKQMNTHEKTQMNTQEYTHGDTSTTNEWTVLKHCKCKIHMQSKINYFRAIVLSK